jgi:5-oxoprolinase (ATP-hydrolysing)
MSSAGGLVEINDYRAKDSMLSGPAGGVVAAAHTARCLGIEQLLTLDMGGTSTDVSRFDKRLDYRSYTQVGEIAIQSPGLMIETVAAGGGSICDFDGIQLIVGPESAGAIPGPACYGAGGPLTVTDVNLLLGRVAPDLFGLPVHTDKAHAALQQVMAKIPEKKGITEEKILLGFLAIANEKMAEAIRKISIHKGFDPRNFALLAFGGAGGQHACGISERLGITRIVAPYHAGLLSAEGMGLARLERFAMRQVLASLHEVEHNLAAIFSDLAKEVGSALETTPGDDPIAIEEQQVYMRLKGQESSLSIDFNNGQALESRFKEAYMHLYHYWPDKAVIEVESVRLVGRKGSVAIEDLRSTKQESQAAPQMHLQSQDHRIPIYDWSALAEGAQMEGPALVVSPYATFCLDIGWRIQVQKQGCLLAEKVKEEVATNVIEDETVRLSLFTHRFQALAEDMGALLERTAFSVNVKERLDFSCALLDREGYLIANAPHIPVHLGSLGVCLRQVIAKYPLNPGDVIVTNHPAFGGSHLPDVTMMCAAFDDKGQKIGYLINRAHHAEIGGKYPGSMPADARYLEEEGVVIAPCYVMKEGKTKWTEISELLLRAKYPTRNLEDNLADLSAALASLQSGKKALELLAQQYGTATLTHYMREIRHNTAQKIKRKLQSYKTQLPLEAEEYLDDGAQIRVILNEGKQKSFCFDFSGSAEVHPGNFNATEAIVHSVVLYVLRLLVDEPIPLNEGLMEEIELILPHGMLNPPFDTMEKAPAVVGGNTELSQRLTDTLLKAFGLAACSQGTMNNTLFGNAHFGFYETLAGGVGAVKGHPGADATHQHMTNTRITDPEIMELRYPIRLEACAIRKNSGGKGQWKGGDGLIRKIRFLAPVSVTMLSQHRQVAPYGLAGGEPGLKGEQWLHYPHDERAVAMPGCFSCQVPEGTLLHIATPGGGAYGK